MKCPNCHGVPYDEVWTCDVCDGKGIVDPLTEQEYLQTCTTEQLAEWLADKLDYCQIMWYWACDKCTWSKKHESYMNDKEKWVEWLKQPHRKEDD